MKFPEYSHQLPSELASYRQPFEKLAGALESLELRGIRSNVGFLRRIVAAPEFRDGQYDTDFINQFMH